MSTGEKLARVSRFYAHHGNSLRLICESSTQLNQLRYLHVKWQDLNRFAVIRRPRVNATRLIHSIAFNFSIAINVIMTIAVHLVTASRGEVCSNFIGWFKDCFRGNLDQVEYFIILFLYNSELQTFRIASWRLLEYSQFSFSYCQANCLKLTAKIIR